MVLQPRDAEGHASPLTPREAFRLWAPSYERETPLSLLEERLFRTLAPSANGLRVLDAGCGTGRRLAGAWAGGGGPRFALGVDLVRAMLARTRRRGEGMGFVECDVRALPLADGTFDLVWCRLVVGFVEEMETLYRELARVTRPDGTLVVTDLHPRSAGAGHVRSFRDGGGLLRTVAHHVHPPEVQTDAAKRAGLDLREHVDLEVGPPVRDVFESHDALDSYEELRGLPVVLGLRFRRRPLEAPRTGSR